ncbi:MAG: Verru_Chthon cassette protein D [Verrucomicrobiota bacterium]
MKRFAACPPVTPPLAESEFTAFRLQTGFSLLELLVVISIMAVLFGLVVPSVSNLLRSNETTNAADKVLAVLSNARHEAIALNRAVEVRIYGYAERGEPGAVKRFRAIQTFLEPDNPSQSWKSLDKLQKLPSSMVFDSGAILSPLIGSLQSYPGSSGTTSDFRIPSIGADYDFVRFSFRADGSTSLDKTQKWFLTIKSLNEPDNSTALPKNYAMVQVFPSRGAIKIYRP